MYIDTYFSAPEKRKKHIPSICHQLDLPKAGFSISVARFKSPPHPQSEPASLYITIAPVVSPLSALLFFHLYKTSSCYKKILIPSQPPARSSSHVLYEKGSTDTIVNWEKLLRRKRKKGRWSVHEQAKVRRKEGRHCTYILNSLASSLL